MVPPQVEEEEVTRDFGTFPMRQSTAQSVSCAPIRNPLAANHEMHVDDDTLDSTYPTGLESGDCEPYCIYAATHDVVESA